LHWSLLPLFWLRVPILQWSHFRLLRILCGGWCGPLWELKHQNSDNRHGGNGSSQAKAGRKQPPPSGDRSGLDDRLGDQFGKLWLAQSHDFAARPAHGKVRDHLLVLGHRQGMLHEGGKYIGIRVDLARTAFSGGEPLAY
jgi:hypothetical protein